MLTPKPAPILSRTPAEVKTEEPSIGQHSVDILKELGISQQETESLIKDRVVQLAKAKM